MRKLYVKPTVDMIFLDAASHLLESSGKVTQGASWSKKCSSDFFSEESEDGGSTWSCGHSAWDE